MVTFHAYLATNVSLFEGLICKCRSGGTDGCGSETRLWFFTRLCILICDVDNLLIGFCSFNYAYQSVLGQMCSVIIIRYVIVLTHCLM